MRLRPGVVLAALCALLTLAAFGAMPTAAADEEILEDPNAIAAACSTTATARTEERTIGDRKYWIYVPAGIPSTGAPLVVSVHGGRNNPLTFEGQTGWTDMARQHRFIVAYPRGSKSDGGGNYSWDFASNSADVPFLRNVVGQIRGRYCVTPSRVHIVGHSNGGQMASRMACNAPDVFASGAVYAGPGPTVPYVGDCNPNRPVSFGLFVGDKDDTVMMELMNKHQEQWRWVNRECGIGWTTETGYDVKDGKRFDCRNGTKVIWRVYGNGEHNYPTGDRRTDMHNRMWSLFQNNPRPF
ncbi:alpha/beta hydrolase family esterase [Nocardia sp. NPDC050406]|uniref:alpha/beta hydrolase family esterase n=1 Tax=Nocardia sp. NPDC050406 TaxID=3364318 RepID=UPI003790B31B